MTPETDNNKEETKKVPTYQTLEPPSLLPSRISPLVIIFSVVAFVAACFAFGSGLPTIVLIVAVIVGLSFVVMVHEASHFLAARSFDMKCTEFFVGFGSRIWSKTRGETEYGVKSIPAGGYVKIIGMTNLEIVDPKDEPRTYRSKKYYQKAIVAIAGVVSHFVMAFIGIVIVFNMHGRPDENAPPIVGSISKYQGIVTPAETIGIKKGDRIVSINGVQFKTFHDLSRYVALRPGKPVEVSWEHNGKIITKEVTPIDSAKLVEKEKFRNDDGKILSRGLIGIGTETIYKKVTFPRVLWVSGAETGRQTWKVVKITGQVFSPSGLKQMYDQIVDSKEADTSKPRVSSPVGIVKTTGEAAKSSGYDLIGLFVGLNLSIGFLNLLPLLPFDGGHLAIASYEAVRSRPGKKHVVDIRKVAPVAYFVVGSFVVLFLASLYLDIVRPIPNPFQ